MNKGIIGTNYAGLVGERLEYVTKLCKDHGYTLKVGKPDAELSFYQDCDIIFGTPAPAIVKELTKLKWLHSSMAGIDGYCKEGIMPEGALLSNTKGGFGIAIAEYLICQLLMLLKQSIGYYKQQEEGLWQSRGIVKGLYGSNITILGFGDIGNAVASRVAPFGAKVRGVKRTVTEKPDYVEALYPFEEVDTALADADVVILCLPNTPTTVGILNKERIATLKKGCIVMNVGRGTALDEEALIKALNDEHLGGAILDVATVEPVPQNHPLWTAKNCLVTPHISGTITLDVTIDKVIAVFEENFNAYLKGERLPTTVDRQKGY